MVLLEPYINTTNDTIEPWQTETLVSDTGILCHVP